MDNPIEPARVEPNPQTIYEADPRAPAPLSPNPAPHVYAYGIPAHDRGAGLSTFDVAAFVVAVVMICGPLLSGVLRAG